MNPSSISPDNLARRDFLKRAAKAGAAVAATAAGAWWLHDNNAPPANPATETAKLPDYSVPSEARKLAIVTGPDRVKTVSRALEALGGLSRFIQRGDRVALKVNAAFASPATLGATSHPDLVAEMVRLCFRAGAASVVVTDNPINDPQSCFALSGIAQAAEAAGGRVVLPTPDAFKSLTVTGGRLIRDWPVMIEPFRGVTKLIGIAPLKDHHRSGASMTMKNWYGLLGGRRNIFHQDIHNIILDLALMVKPTLVILDGTTTMMSNGPTGGSLEDLKSTNTLIAGTDQVAVDAFGATLLGKTAADLPFMTKAAAAGIGTLDYESLKPARDHVDSPTGGVR